MAAQGAVQPFHWHYGDLDDRNFQVSGSSLLALLIIISGALLLALLCFYLRWACRYCSWASAATLTPGAAPPRPSGLDAETINSLPTRLHKSVQPRDKAQCSICLGGLVEGETVKVLPSCTHSFHPGCVDEWLRAHPSCPLCRALIGRSSVAEVEGVV